MRWKSSFVSGLAVLGLVLLFAGERVVGGGTWEYVLSFGGLAVFVAALKWRGWRWLKARGEVKFVEGVLLAVTVVLLGAVVLYGFTSSAWTWLMGTALSQTSPRANGVLTVLWPALSLALIPLLLVELAYASVGSAEHVEKGRIVDAAYSGVGVGCALIFAFATQYVASERDARVDLSYFRTARPGEATRNLVRSLDEPLTITTFFPPANDVAEQVAAYFDDIKAESKNLKLERLDFALEPKRAKELGIASNGAIVISKGERRETVTLGLELERARPQLRSLDQDVQAKLVGVARSKKTIYFTSGHGERTEDPINASDQRPTIASIKSLLRRQNYELKSLSTAEGLAVDVPKDAAAVMIIGPQQPFSEAEAKTLEAYGRRGGHLFVALDPEAGQPFTELLKPLGLTLSTTQLANATVHARKSGSPADNVILVTRQFSSHAALSTASRAGFPVALLGAGAVEEAKVHDADVSIDISVRGEKGTFDDGNANFTFDPPKEQEKLWGLGAAVTRRSPNHKAEEDLRAFVLGDSDAVCDELLAASPGNQYLVLDSLKWLLGEEKLSGEINTEVDAPLSRTRQQDAVWFYATTFLFPAGIVGFGVFFSRKHKRGARKTAEAKS